MVQEGYEDYYLGEHDSGCCLKCSESHPGCLCYDCGCTKCYWYSPPHEGLSYDDNGMPKGTCLKKFKLIEQKKEEAKERYKKIEEEKWNYSQKLKELNKIVEDNKKEGEVLNYYTCQKCNREFCTVREYEIILTKKPYCHLCRKK